MTVNFTKHTSMGDGELTCIKLNWMYFRISISWADAVHL